MSSSEADDKEAQEKKRQHEVDSAEEEESASKGEPIQARLRAKKARASNIYSSSSEENNSDEDRKKRSKKNGKTKSKTSTSTKFDADSEEDDIEEGEVSGDSSADESETQYDDGYNEDLMGDDEDRARLAAMTEREREQEIFKRLELRQTLKRRREIERKLRKQRSKKAVNDTSARSRERRLMMGTSKETKAFEKLKNARDEKRNKAAEQEKKKVAAGLSKMRREEVEDDNEEKDEEFAGTGGRKKVDASDSDEDEKMDSDEQKEEDEKNAQLEPVEKLEELEKICISRDQLIRWIFYPMYAETIKGCFVRVNCGDQDSKGNIIYRLAEILGTTEASDKYTVTETGKQPTPTKIILRLKVLEKEKEMMLKFVSNGKPSESEFEYFTTKMNNRQLTLPSHAHVVAKIQNILSASKYRMTDEDITRKMSILAELNGGPITKNLALRKSDLIKDRQEAMFRSDTEALGRIQEELDEINLKIKQRDAGRATQQTNLEIINKKNSEFAMDALTKAMKSRERDTSDRGQEDPFTRRWGTPTLVHKKTGQNFVTPVTPQNTPVHSTTATPTGGTPAAGTPAARVDPFNVHNFDIGINIEMADFPMVSNLFTSRRSK